ncbi:MAG TPA: multidrug effflux MFS transporter [Rubrivivax sp.]|jgi:DHA1 family bicyclomycin/chloramphenicol resistance-like MFS transporter|nr:multidrug effflux MFS transporter [Pseudomonadota bacterium]HOL36489.1 multidrug effflux MFS transporter [Rubrivivax sp.]HPP83203.1 multidrug effflux MFS transporter [Rubrivivax sp.]
MHPDAQTLWRGSRWTLTLLIACLSMLGPFSIDTYLPAFSGIGASIGASPAEMQQTLSSYLLGFAVMNLFHGALSDSFGRRPVVLVGAAVFTLASIGCALSNSIGWLVAFRALQGLSAGTGMVVSRAIIRDLYGAADAQRAMSQVTLYFAVAPAVAPLLGGWVFAGLGWHAIFWMLALLGLLLWIVIWRRLPETLHHSERQPLHLLHLLRGYAGLVRSPQFLALVVASGIPFNGMFLYVLAAPAFVGEHLGLAPTQFFWFFAINVSGIMAGAWLSGRLAGRVPWRRQIRWGFVVMSVVSVLNVVLNLVFEPNAWWSMWPIGLYALGWSLMTPVVTLLVLDQVPERRGMASSVHSSISSAANALVAGALTPLVMNSPRDLALAALVLMAAGLVSWTWVKRQVT